MKRAGIIEKASCKGLARVINCDLARLKSLGRVLMEMMQMGFPATLPKPKKD